MYSTITIGADIIMYHMYVNVTLHVRSSSAIQLENVFVLCHELTEHLHSFISALLYALLVINELLLCIPSYVYEQILCLEQGSYNEVMIRGCYCMRYVQY